MTGEVCVTGKGRGRKTLGLFLFYPNPFRRVPETNDRTPTIGPPKISGKRKNCKTPVDRMSMNRQRS